MTINSDKVEKWHRWLDAIEGDLRWVFRQKAVYDEFVRVANSWCGNKRSSKSLPDR